MNSAPVRKKIDDYEYRVEVHDVDLSTGTVHLLFSEVDGNDGFGVSVSKDELQRMVEDGTFDDWAQRQVESRINLLKQVESECQAREKIRKSLSLVETALKAKKIKPRKKGGGAG